MQGKVASVKLGKKSLFLFKDLQQGQDLLVVGFGIFLGLKGLFSLVSFPLKNLRRAPLTIGTLVSEFFNILLGYGISENPGDSRNRMGHGNIEQASVPPHLHLRPKTDGLPEFDRIKSLFIPFFIPSPQPLARPLRKPIDLFRDQAFEMSDGGIGSDTGQEIRPLHPLGNGVDGIILAEIEIFIVVA